jgi:hypothetical protein
MVHDSYVLVSHQVYHLGEVWALTWQFAADEEGVLVGNVLTMAYWVLSIYITRLQS